MRKIDILLAILTGVIIGLVITAGLGITTRADAAIGEPDFSERFADVAEEVMPSVVTITSAKIYEMPVRTWEPFWGDDFFDFFFGPRYVPRYKKKEFKQEALGSGVIVSEDGYILTNAHVVRGADEIKVHIGDETYDARIVGKDDKTDIAVIKVDADKKLPAAKLGDSDKIRVGEWVLAIGSPFRLEHTVTAGIISAKGRSRMGIADYEDFIQTDAAINPGNSGGALVNLRGEVIGINTAIFSRTGGNIGIGFAIPINLAKKVMDQIIEHGRVIRGWLGVTIQDIDDDIAMALGLNSKKGVLVASVVPGSPADDAGIHRGDVIISVDDEPINNVEDLRNKIANTEPGTKVKIKIIRNGKKITKKVELGELPGEENVSSFVGGQEFDLGLSVRPLSPSEASRLGYDGEGGVLVTDVKPGSIADKAGVQPDDILLEVNQIPIDTPSDLAAAIDQIKHDKVALFVVFRNGSTMYLATKIK